MGNESSRLKGLETEKNTVEANDFWALYNAEAPTTSNEEGRQLLSIFQGEPVVNGQLWVAQGPMERAIKNLKIYRHPYILKYVATWEQGGQKHLATERVRPLIAVMSTQSDIQVCLGLRTILCSLIFLVEKALARHLNICTASIYVTERGSWCLAGFEYVWKRKDVTKALLDLASTHRYRAAIDDAAKEDDNSIEQYAFATLCEEILAKCARRTATDDDDTPPTPHVAEFREYCATHLRHRNAQMRPKLSAILLHPYFNHEFVLIHSFLFELPLKSLQQKQDFFTGLIQRLRCFGEEVVGAQLGADLLSRMVLLDPTAQLCVTPFVLRTKTDHAAALFSPATYTRHLMPHLKRMFRLRDAQIRLILLEYFMEFVRLLTLEELEADILPHLLAGMNDTNDVLVAKTLRCLADLIPLLGAATVIGGQRLRLFSDGRPQAAVPAAAQSSWVEARSITPVMDNGDCLDDYMVSGSPLPLLDAGITGSCDSLTSPSSSGNNGSTQLDAMPPRLSPDGGEDVANDSMVQDELTPTSSSAGGSATQTDAELLVGNVLEGILHNATSMSAMSAPLINGNEAPPNEFKETDDQKYDDEEEEAWSDWETDELQRVNNETNAPLPSATTSPSNILSIATQLSTADSVRTTPTSSSTHTTSSSASVVKPRINDDLSALDIMVQKSATPLREQSAEFDFFKDMEPVFASNSGALDMSLSKSVTATTTSKAVEELPIRIDASRFAVAAADDDVAYDDAWGVDDVGDNVDTAVSWHA